ncbi:hypothetical protein SLE2022_145600 [Rubroshorea leprosula]
MKQRECRKISEINSSEEATSGFSRIKNGIPPFLVLHSYTWLASVRNWTIALDSGLSDNQNQQLSRSVLVLYRWLVSETHSKTGTTYQTDASQQSAVLIRHVQVISSTTSNNV